MAQENSGTSWSQTNGYDQYGNRWIDLGGGSQSLYFNTSNNRITNSGYAYDNSGNLQNDGSHSYTFDGESRIIKVDSTTAYVYDGEGKRVKKLVGENTRFVYGTSGQLVAEFDGSNGTFKKEYVYGGGMQATIDATNGTQYTTTDTLGSPRVATNSSAAVVSRHDYLPFGTELFAGTGGRTAAMGFSATDGNRKKFTGYERDSETGLDFAQGRYYNPSGGRFTSPDPLLSSSRPSDPQSWNKYSYVRNNPLNRVDPSGLWDWGPSLGGPASDAELRKNACAKAVCTEGERKAGKRSQSEINQIIGQREQFRQAIRFLHALLDSSLLTPAEQSRLQSISKAYGTENDHNLVFVEPDNGSGQETSSLSGLSVVLVDFTKKGAQFNLSVVHEGEHVADYFDYFYRNGADLTQYEMEVRGWEAEGIAAKGKGYPQWETQAGTPQDQLLWNKSWAPADVEAARSRAATTVVSKRYPGLGPTSQGPRFSNLHRQIIILR